MTAVVPRVGEDELWDLAGHLDIAAVVDPATGGSAHPVWCGCPVGPGGRRGEVVRRDPATGDHVALPAGALAALRAAGCAVGATRRLLGSTVLTVAVVGTAPEVWWHVWTLCRWLPSVTAVAVAARPVTRVPARIVDEAALAGVEISGPGTVRAAVFGANLVVAVSPGAVGVDRLGAGTVLVEAVPGAVTPAARAAAVAVVAGDTAVGRPVRPDGFTLVPAPLRTAHLDAVLAERLLAVRARLRGRRCRG